MNKDIIFAEERKTKILDYLNKNHKATVPELCKKFNMSSATIRNDLRDLHQQKMITRTHGGAMSKSQSRYELNSSQKEGQHIEVKQAIAEKALTLIEPGDTILLDSSSTVMELAKLLQPRQNVSVVTNDLNICLVLEELQIDSIYLIGGLVRQSFHCTVGAFALELLKKISVDKAFMGANGISMERGASTPDVSHADIKRAMSDIASKTIFLCDDSKIGKNSFVQFTALENIDTLVTNKIKESDRKTFEKAGIEILLADS